MACIIGTQACRRPVEINHQAIDPFADRIRAGRARAGHRPRHEAHVQDGDAIDRGAKAVCGASRPDGAGYFYPPTVLAGVEPGSRILKEEVFGPVLAVIPFDDEAEAIARERELLRTLRPKFNTVGTYPAPRQYIGWRRSESELLLGWGEATDGWEHRIGEFTRLKPVHAALLRLLWRALHPTDPWSDMPSAFLRDTPPPVCRLRESRHTGAALLGEVVPRLEGFLRGTLPEFPDWLRNLAPGGSRFEEQWREQDALYLQEFFERQFGSETNQREGGIA
jgi:hypothetical protein